MATLVAASVVAPAAASAEPPSAPLPAVEVGQLEASTTAAAAAAVVPAPVSTYTAAPEELGRYVPQVSCDPVERPGAQAFRALLDRTYGANAGGITRACSSSRTEHSEGRAYDWMRDAGEPAEAAQVEAFLGWLIGPDAEGVPAGNARRLGVMYVIWDRKIWGSYNQTWKAYTGASPHRDHVHVSFTWDGAMGRTSFWRGRTATGQDYGPCQVYVGEAAPAYSGRNTSPCPPAVPRTPTPTPTPTPVVAVPTTGVPLVGDWDGSGGDKVGWYRDGVVSLRMGPTTAVTYRFGKAGDLPVVGDFDGDGKDSVGIYRAGQWHLRNSHSSGGADHYFVFGNASQVPVVGRWGGGQLGVGVVSGRRWLLRGSLSGGGYEKEVNFGAPGDVPMAGDWDGDGKDSPGVRRERMRYLLNGQDPSGPVTAVSFGSPSDRGISGDFNRDGSDTVGIERTGLFAWRDDLRGGGATASIRYAGPS
ncbi:hypothetical protein [uncultured Pseudokineococcus sp.]|uniref:hypothetical protein n=1 Tax=uncultured Pseudokineococcus sp. TaxID=1642928 RepID=UPI0026317C82|nr:hypothetical protein [uncultured Pseudokineococcus sp.]